MPHKPGMFLSIPDYPGDSLSTTEQEDDFEPSNHFHDFVVRGPSLSDVDVCNLTPEQVLFYFGILALQDKNIEPAFEYIQERDGRWSVRLSMCRDSLKLPSMISLLAAKVEITRVALSILKGRFAGWMVPDEPGLGLTAPKWHWFDLLQGHTKEMDLLAPEYTRYTHKLGFRYEIAVGTVTGLGKRRFYVSEVQAINAAAHEVLYLLLTGELRSQSGPLAPPAASPAPTAKEMRGEQSAAPSSHNGVRSGSLLFSTTTKTSNGVITGCEGLSMRNRSSFGNEKSLQHQVKSSTNSAETIINNSINKGPRGRPAAEPLYRISKPDPGPGRGPTQGAGAGPGRTRSRRKANKAKGCLSNLVPVVNPRITMEAVHGEPSQARKWNTSPESLTGELAKLKTYHEKFDKLCTILSLTPAVVEYKKLDQLASSSCLSASLSLETKPLSAESLQRSIFDTSHLFASYSVWTTFPSDPFLSRAGPIGKIESFHGTLSQAQDLGYKKVIEYLIKLVKEDYELEREEKAQMEKIARFPHEKIKVLKASGQLNRSIHR